MAGSLKQVELTKEVKDLSDVPYLNLGQEIQSKRNLVRYWTVISALVKSAAELQAGVGMPLPNSSYVNILVDDPEMDFYNPKFVTFHRTGEKLNRFGTDIQQEKLQIEAEFVGIIKRIRNELNIEGAKGTFPATSLGIGASGEIPLDPRAPSTFLAALCEHVFKFPLDPLGSQNIGGGGEGEKAKKVTSYDVDLPYFR